MHVNRGKTGPSYALVHKFTLFFLKLAGLDPNVSFSSQVKSDRLYCNWVWKLLSWIYSLSILTLLVANLVFTIRSSLLSPTLHTKKGVVFFLWRMTFGTQMLILPLVFIVKNGRISKMNMVLIRWIKNYFFERKMPLFGVLVWKLHFVISLVLVILMAIFFCN